jgi:hypothetical protein
MRSDRSLSLAACVFGLALHAPSALAQPLSPKVCVAVARDPDPAVRTLASRLDALLGASPAVRGIADPDARALLRGDPSSDAAHALAIARRALDFTESDRLALTRVAESLGCSRVLELSSTPRGVMIRQFDVLAQSFDPGVESSSWTDQDLASRAGISPSPPARASAPSSAEPARALAPAARSVPRRITPSDPRVAPDRSSNTSPDSSAARRAPTWAFVAAGVAGAALVGGFIAAQSLGPSIPVVHVSGPGALR